jgi:hypothetical protein
MEGRNPLKMLEKFGYEKYVMAKIIQVNMVCGVEEIPLQKFKTFLSLVENFWFDMLIL